MVDSAIDREVEAVGKAPTLSEAVEDDPHNENDHHCQQKRLVCGVTKGAVEGANGDSILSED
jgi:hypothetical protein